MKRSIPFARGLSLPEEAVTEQQRRGLTLALKNIDRLIGMIDGLLDFSRADSRVGQLELSRFRFAPLAEEAAELLGERVAEREIDLRVVVEPDLVVEADRGKMLQVLLNLLTNAVKHTRRGGRIELTARRGDPGFATVRVRDQGSGIPREALHRIFERHYQAETGTGHAAEGAGLGLAIVRDILRLHG